MHKQTIICRRLFAGQVVKGKKKTHWMKKYVSFSFALCVHNTYMSMRHDGNNKLSCKFGRWINSQSAHFHLFILSWLLIPRHSFRVCFIGISGSFFCAIVFTYFGEAKLNQTTSGEQNHESGDVRAVTWRWQNWASDWLVTNAAVGTVHDCKFFSNPDQKPVVPLAARSWARECVEHKTFPSSIAQRWSKCSFPLELAWWPIYFIA